MCCYNYPTALKKMLAGWKPGRVRTYWKCYNPARNALYSSVFGARVSRAGVVRSNSRRTRPCLSSGEIDRGIHVFLTLDWALSQAQRWGDIVVPVRCRKDDLFAVSFGKSGTAVFRQVEITPTAFRKATKQGA